MKKFVRKLCATLMAAITAVTAVSVSAFATPAPDDHPKTITLGKEVRDNVPHTDATTWRNYKVTVPATGEYTLHFSFRSESFYVNMIDNDANKKDPEHFSLTTGLCYLNNKRFIWDEKSESCVGDIYYYLKKGTYYFQFDRWEGGSGDLKFTFNCSKLDSPAHLSLSRKGNGIYAEWDTVTDRFKNVARAYKVRYKASGDKKWTLTDARKNYLTLRNLKPGTKYAVQTAAVNGKRIGNWSKAAVITTAGKNVPASQFKAPNISCTVRVTFSWKKIDGAASYRFMYKANNGKWVTKKVTKNSITLNVKKGVKYTYKAAGVDGKGKVGKFSAAKVFKF